MFRSWGLGASLLVAVFSGLSCGQESTSPRHDTPAALGSTREAASASVGDEINPRLLRRFQPLPPVSAGAKDEIDLGRMLFFDTRLSVDNDLSCSSCHTLNEYGVDHRKTSVGHNGQLGTRNAPSVFNTGGHFAHFWDGRATDLEDQSKMPILNPAEMGMPSATQVIDTLKAIPGYVEAFKRAFPNDADALTYDNLGRAIGAFERGLATPGRWDLYLEGDRNALTEAERAGLKTFLNSGCMVCHTGAYVGGSMFERAGAVEPWPNQSDQGRYEVTHVDADKMMFKVPSLRNVEKTAPYFHDGSVATLDDAVRMMGKHQLGIDLADDEVSSIVTWLKSLTGTIPQSYIARPELPKSPGGTN